MKLEHLRVDFTHIASHPSRGAWIEIYRGRSISTMMDVAPLTGCVD